MKRKEQGRNTQAGNEFARQGIPFGQFVQTQLAFPHSGVLFLFSCDFIGKKRYKQWVFSRKSIR
jgi:hypothetical protein